MICINAFCKPFKIIPLVSGEDGRRTIELFTAICSSTRDNSPIKFPLQAENKDDMDGRI